MQTGLRPGASRRGADTGRNWVWLMRDGLHRRGETLPSEGHDLTGIPSKGL